MTAWLEQLERELGAEAFGESNDSPPTVAPDSVEGLQAALALAREHRLTVLPQGLGSKAGWCAPARADLVLSTRRLAGVTSYEPGDGTVSALAGTPLRALRDAVRAGGHHLTPDVPHPDRATLGGVVAAGQSGFDRLRYGPVRNALLGARVLLADGRLAKSGGQLVKNVTGYDLHRLYCGSHGTLCVIVEASLRLHPLPEERRVLSRDGADPALARAALAAPVRHLAVWSDRARTSVALTGRAEVVAHEAGLVRAALGGDVEELDGADAEQRCGSARDAAADAELELASRRTALAPALERLAAAAGEAGLTPRALAHPGVAQAFLRFDAPVPEGARAALDASLANAGVRVAWRSGGGSAPDGDALAMMRALRDALDPDALFARGRMPGGL